MIRRLGMNDFSAVWDMGLGLIDDRLRPDPGRAKSEFLRVVTAANVFAAGDFDDGLKSAAIVVSSPNPWAGKQFGAFQLWLGTVAALDAAVEWWESRPAMRCLTLQFPVEVPRGTYRLLRMRGFERCGDMNILWR